MRASDLSLEQFRQTVREFFARDYPADLLERNRRGFVLSRDEHISSQQALQSRGWLAGWWPVEHGGQGWSFAQRHVFEEEAGRAGMPVLMPMALIYVGPVIYTFGTAEQQRRWLPDILSSRALWAQGYSEPEAGSDLANLSLAAVRDGEDYVLNGTKIWTSYAQWADWIFCLVRTSRGPRRQDGISFLCLKADTPGVTILPIVTIDGEHHLNRIDFQEVRVPVEQRIGEEGKGWHYATFLLQGERLSYAHVARKRAALQRIRQRAGAGGEGTARILDDPAFAARLAACEIETDVLDRSVARVMAAGDAPDPAQVPAIKIQATELAQRITELACNVAGNAASVFADRTLDDWPQTFPLVPEFAAPAMGEYLYERAQSIYGGANEVQKSIVWRSLGSR